LLVEVLPNGFDRLRAAAVSLDCSVQRRFPDTVWRPELEVW
jgi:hypothetical protein